MPKEYPVRPVPGAIYSEADVVFLAAGGPSLRDFDWKRLETKEVIAINKSLYTCPKARVLWFSDDYFYDEHKEIIDSHGAQYKCSAYADVYLRPYPPHIYTYKFDRMRGLQDGFTTINHGNNGGYAAICLAAKLGAKKLVLLGYDFKYGPNGESHWHEGHFFGGKKQFHREDALTHKMLPCFDTLKWPLIEKRVTVYNASPDSNLLVWPRITHEEALSLC